MADEKSIIQSDYGDILKVEGINFKGYGIVPKYAMTDPALTIEAKGIYAYLCSFSGRGTSAFPTRNTILSDLKIGKDAYYNHFRLLCDEGYIVVTQTKGERSVFAKNIYTIVSNPKKLKIEEISEQDIRSKLMAEKIRISGLKALGYGMIPKAVMVDPRLSLKAKAVYAYFCSYTGAGNSAFPFRDQIQRELQVSLKAYYKYFNMLLEYNYITVIQRRVDGKMSVNDYYLNDMPDIEIGKKCGKNQFLRADVAREQPCSKNPDTVGVSERPCSKNPDTVNLLERPCGKNPDTVNLLEEPCGKNPDTVNLLERPCGKNPDTVNLPKEPCGKKSDTLKSDTPNPDTNNNTINSNTVNNNINTYIHSLTLSEDGKIKERVRKEILMKKKVPYEYAMDKVLMTEAIHFLTYWDIRYPKGYFDDMMQRTYNLFNEALISMCTTKIKLELKGEIIEARNIIERINRLGIFEDEGVNIEDIVSVATDNFYHAIGHKEIRNPLKYMQSCIWDALRTDGVSLYAGLKKDCVGG